MSDEWFMKRCIELARNGLGTTYPNPMVGSVIVCKDTIIGEGWHKKAGEAHAEVNAVNSVKNRELLKDSTIYVSLEPCSHFGKTPPCSDMIIAENIPNVVVGTVDPNALVAGKGIAKLRAAGINVKVGILEAQCRALNKRFFTFHDKKRPYIILKWAESADGFLSPETKNSQNPVWVSNVYSRQLVHKWRGEEASILAGTQTVIDDNPRLNARDWAAINQPIRIVIDKANRIPPHSHIFDNQQKTIVICEKIVHAARENVIFETVDFQTGILPQLMEVLHRRGIESMIVEGGRQTLQSFIETEIWDEARVFKSKTMLHRGTPAPDFDWPDAKKQLIADDELLTFWNHDKHDYF